jgi:hypothetical protein
MTLENLTSVFIVAYFGRQHHYDGNLGAVYGVHNIVPARSSE